MKLYFRKVLLSLAFLLSGAVGGPAFAQADAARPGVAAPVTVPYFWDPRLRMDRPSLGGRRAIRFLTDDEFPPLQFTGPDGVPTGFLVELARAACEVLDVACTIQARRFDTLPDALAEGRGDAVAAAIPVTADLRRRFSVTLPVIKMPARFAAKGGAAPFPVTREALAGRKVAVVEGSAHEAYLKAYMPEAQLRPAPSFEAATAILREGQAELMFADGLALSIWLGGSGAAGCCAFVGGPYLDAAFFGEGIGFVTRPDDEALRRSLDYALQVVAERGIYAQLYLRFFPVGFF